MKLEVLDSKEYDLIKENKLLKEILMLKKFNVNTNEVYDAILGVNNNRLRNYCIIRGTQDNGLFNLNLDKVKQLSFLKKCLEYVFTVFNAKTISIFSKEEISSLLLPFGFEYLGIVDGKNTYIKEKKIQVNRERSIFV